MLPAHQEDRAMTDREKCKLIMDRMDGTHPGEFNLYDDNWSDDDVEYFVANYEEDYITRWEK